MKTSAVNNSLIQQNKNRVSFKGHTAYTTDSGHTRHKFYLPFDANRYTAQIEFRNFVDKKGEWHFDEDDTTTIARDLPANGLDIRDAELSLDKNNPIGYRYVLTPKSNPNERIYKLDAGIISNIKSENPNERYTILLNNRTVLSDNGLTKQVMPDILPGYRLMYNNKGQHKIVFDADARQRALEGRRTHGNKLGGNFAGIIQMLPTWEQEGYTKLVGTPFTKDEVSSHLYWTENPYLVSNALGTLEDFKTMQKALFQHGMNFIADGAFVNQGLQGILFKNLLKHGENSPFYHWFKAPGILGGDFKIGAIPKKEKARENFRFRLVNAPVKIAEKDGFISVQKNSDYDRTKTSFIQLYDKRLVTEKELQDSSNLLSRYSITNTKNPYEITGHDDTTQLISFEINPKQYSNKLKKTISSIPKNERKFTNQELVESLLSFPNFRIGTKDKGGFDLWDGNMDIAKLSFYIGNTDNQLLDRFENKEDKARELNKMQKAVYQVQDFTLGAGKYWTKLVADTQLEHIANILNGTKDTTSNYKAAIHNAVENGLFPKKVEEVMTDKVISNVLNNNYALERTQKDTFGEDHWVTGYLRQRVTDFPLDTIEFAPDLNAVIASPFISKRATNKEELDQTRLQIYAKQYRDPKKNIDPDYAGPYQEMDRLLVGKTTEFAKEIIFNINDSLIKDYEENTQMIEGADDDKRLFNIEKKEEISEFGKYVMPLLLPEIMKFAMVKGLNPKAKIEFNEQTGQITYDEKALRNFSLKTIGADGSPKDEASKVVATLDKGISLILKDIKEQNNIFDNDPFDSDNDTDSNKHSTKTTPIRNDNLDVVKLCKTLKSRVDKLSRSSLRMAEAIMDQTESGLGWRIDAAKDIGNIDALRTKNDSSEDLMRQVTDFWGKFNDTVKSQNKHAYTTAEITDLGSVLDNPNGVFKNYIDGETKFIEQSGLNNTANYMFFYSMLKNLFSLNAETGAPENFNDVKAIRDKLVEGWNKGLCQGFLYQYPDDSIANSYTFVGNHDKPRVLHIFALDMELFHSNFTDAKRPDGTFPKHKQTAVKVLNLKSENELDVYTLSGKAVAMGDRILTALSQTGQLDGSNGNALREAIAELAGGIYDGEKFNADAFGTRDFRHAIKDVFDIAQKKGYKSDNIKANIDKTLENILVPAMDKMESVYKMLVTLPGSPTDFVGDKEGSSGYETKSNNDFQQNRNVVPFEWVNKELKNPYLEEFNDSKDFAVNYYVNMTKIGNLRNKKELSALRNGNTISLPVQNGVTDKGEHLPVAATFRYDDKGSQVICLYTTSGANLDNSKMMNRDCVNLDKIVLNDNTQKNWKEGLKGGLNVGDTFLKVDDNARYKVFLENGEYCIKRVDSPIFRSISILPQDKNTAVLYKIDPKAYQPIHATLFNDNMI